MSISAFNDLFSEIANPENKSLQQGELLFEQGDPAVNVFVVQKGCIRLVRYTHEGYTVPIYSAFPGESFAEAAMFSDIYHCDAEAVLPSTVLCYPKEQVFYMPHLENLIDLWLFSPVKSAHCGHFLNFDPFIQQGNAFYNIFFFLLTRRI